MHSSSSTWEERQESSPGCSSSWALWNSGQGGGCVGDQQESQSNDRTYFTPITPSPCVVLCRWTTTCLRRLWCTGTVCQKVSWGWWSSTRSHSWSNALTLSPATNPSWSSSWSRSASTPPCTPAVPTRLARLHLELFWITPSLTETGQVYSWCQPARGCVTILTLSFFFLSGSTSIWLHITPTRAVDSLHITSLCTTQQTSVQTICKGIHSKI